MFCFTFRHSCQLPTAEVFVTESKVCQNKKKKREETENFALLHFVAA